MLGLTRRPGTSIVLIHETTGERITVHHQRTNHFAVEAAKCWKILRTELLDADGNPLPKGEK